MRLAAVACALDVARRLAERLLRRRCCAAPTVPRRGTASCVHAAAAGRAGGDRARDEHVPRLQLVGRRQHVRVGRRTGAGAAGRRTSADRVVATRLSARTAVHRRPHAAARRRRIASSRAARRGFREPPVAGEVLRRGDGRRAKAGTARPASSTSGSTRSSPGPRRRATRSTISPTPTSRSSTEALAGYRLVVVVGHSEYWSLAPARRVERFVDARRRPRDLLRQHLLLAVPLGGRRTHVRRLQEPRRGRGSVARRSRAPPSHLGPVVEPVGRPAGGGAHRPVVPLRRLSSLRPVRQPRASAATPSGATTTGRSPAPTSTGATSSATTAGWSATRTTAVRFTIGDDGLPRRGAAAGRARPVSRSSPPRRATLAEPESTITRSMVPPEAWDVAGARVCRLRFAREPPSAAARSRRDGDVHARRRRGLQRRHDRMGLRARGAATRFVDRITRNVLDRFSA